MKCILTLGYNNYFINVDDAITIVNLLGESVQVDWYIDEKYTEKKCVKDLGNIDKVNTCKIVKAPVDDIVEPPPPIMETDDDMPF